MDFILARIKIWLELALAVGVAALVWWAYHTIYERGADSVQRRWDAVEKERAEASAKVTADALQVTKDLQASADKDKGIKDAQIKTLNSNLAAALVGLSNRPARPGDSSVPSNTPAGAGCTGSGLFRPDAEFLVRETARADKLRLDLQQCQARYEAARAAVK